jgi:hypothetical protein
VDASGHGSGWSAGRVRTLAGALALCLGALLCGVEAHAFPQYGTAVNDYCASSGGTPSMPYTGDCALCHSATNAGSGRTALFTAYRNNDLAAFCPMAMNQAPTIDPIAALDVSENTLVEIDVRASDPDGDGLFLEASNLPTGATFRDQGGGRGLFSWTPGFQQAGNHPVSFIATDDGSPPESVTETVTITVGNVNRAPVLSPVGTQAVDVGQPLQVALSATDPDGDGLSFGHGGLPGDATLSDAGNGSATLSWTPTAGDAGSWPVTVTVTDDGMPMASDAVEFAIVVGSVNQPPVLQPIGDRTAGAGELWEVQLSATDPNGDSLTFACDGAPAGSSLTDTGNGSALLGGTAPAGGAMNFAITCEVSDTAVPPGVDTEAFTLTVGSANRPPIVDPIGVTEQAGTYYVRVTARDPDGDALVFDVTGAPSDADFYEVGPGAAELSWTPTPETMGTYPLMFTVTDDGTPPEMTEREVMLEVAPPAPDAGPVSIRRARWQQRRGVLGLYGDGAPPWSDVEIVEATSGVSLGVVVSDEEGGFRGRIPVDQSTDLCSVQARVGSQTSEPVDVRERDGRLCGSDVIDPRPRGGRRGGDDDDDDDEHEEEDD